METVACDSDVGIADDDEENNGDQEEIIANMKEPSAFESNQAALEYSMMLEQMQKIIKMPPKTEIDKSDTGYDSESNEDERSDGTFEEQDAFLLDDLDENNLGEGAEENPLYDISVEDDVLFETILSSTGVMSPKFVDVVSPEMKIDNIGKYIYQ